MGKTHGSLFNGIGGFQLAAEWMGWENMMSCEIDEWCNKVTKQHFPECKQYEDITTTDFTIWNGRIDILTGGFPCQPFSTAGKRKGETDNRYLWPQMLRAIREIKPAFIVAENVSGLVSMEDGATLERVLSDLENEGYEVEPCLIPAASVGAWHRRERIWIIGYSKHNGPHEAKGRGNEKEPSIKTRTNEIREFEGANSIRSSITSNTDNLLHTGGLDGRANQGTTRASKEGTEREGQTSLRERVWDEPCASGETITDTRSIRQPKPRESRRSRNSKENRERKINRAFDDSIWSFEPGVGRVANGIPNRMDRIKGLGNAIVPQVAYEIFKAIQICV